MRVAVVAEETPYHDDSDAAHRLDRLAVRLSERGHDVTIFCAKWWGGTVKEWVSQDDVTYQAVTTGLDVPSGRFPRRLPWRLRRFSPDVIHASHANLGALHAAKFASTLLRTPLVVDWFDHVPREGWRERLRRLGAQAPDAITTPSRLVQTGLRELGRSTDDVRVVPTAVDMEAIREAEVREVADVVYSRRLDETANLESLLLGLAELRDLGWSAAVIGDGPARAEYEEQASDLRIDDRVEFLGTLPVDERIPIFKGAHVAVHTALYAPFATDFLRALACGCIGLAEYHAQSAAHELIEARERGVRTTSEDELVAAIRDAADKPHKTVDEDFAQFDERAVLEDYLECFREVREAYGLF